MIRRLLLLAAIAGSARAGDRAAGWQATVADLTGLARIQAVDGTAWTAAAAGAVLNPGDTFLTLGGGRARLEFPDGTRIHLGPESRLVVSPDRATGRHTALLRGFARFIAAKLGTGAGELTVVTPTAIAAVKGTEFTLNVSDAVTDIAVLSGEVRCSDRERRYAILMRAGEAARWDRNGIWEPPHRLAEAEMAAQPGDDPPPPPATLRFGGYVITDYRHSDDHGSGFRNPWMSLQAASPLGDRGQTFWELWIQGIGGGQTGGTPASAHGRLDLLAAWAELDAVRSTSGPAPLAVRAGILGVPIGLLNRTHDMPQRVFTSTPIFSWWMVPVPWRDLGVQVSSGWTGGLGTLRLEAAAVNGLQIEPADPLESSRVTYEGLWWARPSEPGRTFNHDNNDTPAFAGRLGWTAGPVALGASGYRGKMDTAGDFTLSMLVGDLTASAEGAGILWTLTSEVGWLGMPDPALTLGSARSGGYAELTARPVGWPVAFGAGYSAMFRRHPQRPEKMHDDVQVAVAFRPVDRLILKLAGEYHQSEFPGSVAHHRDLIAQIAALW